jgi:hypothetical protein
MNVELIRERLGPGFRPFAVVISSGHKFPVPHPEFILLARRAVVIADQRGYAISLDPLHIVGLEDLPATRNGRYKRRAKR